ncbi:hypothetical protein [Clostridium sp. C105KSO13]|nr:hypothetical protein [Clostridium sp. C105KSO13]
MQTGSARGFAKRIDYWIEHEDRRKNMEKYGKDFYITNSDCTAY